MLETYIPGAEREGLGAAQIMFRASAKSKYSVLNTSRDQNSLFTLSPRA